MLYDFFLKNLFIFIIIMFVIAFLLFFEIFYFKRFKNAIKVIDVVKFTNHSKAVIFDLRSELDYRSCHILDSINFPIDTIYKTSILIKKYKNRTIILICNNNSESLKAFNHFKKFVSHDLFYLEGGFNSWLKENMPTTSL